MDTTRTPWSGILPEVVIWISRPLTKVAAHRRAWDATRVGVQPEAVTASASLKRLYSVTSTTQNNRYTDLSMVLPLQLQGWFPLVVQFFYPVLAQHIFNH